MPSLMINFKNTIKHLGAITYHLGRNSAFSNQKTFVDVTIFPFSRN